MATAMTFDVLSLQDSTQNGIHTTETDVFDAPPIEVQEEKLAESDGSVIVKKRIAAKTFKCEGYMQMDTPALLDSLIDTFKRGLNKQEQNFDVDYAGSTRRYVATPKNIMISRRKGLNTCGWSVEFLCANPVGMNVTSSTLLAATAISTSTNTAGITVDGSYKAEPLITLTLTSVTGGSPSKTITISNSSTLRGVSVTRDWANGDVLEIDCFNKTIYVNNVAVENGGQFPSWEPGSNAISYLDDFTTRSASITATYTKRYL